MPREVQSKIGKRGCAATAFRKDITDKRDTQAMLDPFLNSLGIETKSLTNEDIDNLVRIFRARSSEWNPDEKDSVKKEKQDTLGRIRAYFERKEIEKEIEEENELKNMKFDPARIRKLLNKEDKKSGGKVYGNSTRKSKYKAG